MLPFVVDSCDQFGPSPKLGPADVSTAVPLTAKWGRRGPLNKRPWLDMGEGDHRLLYYNAVFSDMQYVAEW